MSGTLEQALGPWRFLLSRYKWDEAVSHEASRVMSMCNEAWLNPGEKGGSPDTVEQHMLRFVIGTRMFKKLREPREPREPMRPLIALPSVSTAEEVLSLLHSCDDIRLHAGGAVLSACKMQDEPSESVRVPDEPSKRRDAPGTKEVKGAMADVDAELKGNTKTSIFVRLDGKSTTLVCKYICEAITSGRVVLDLSDLTEESLCKDKRSSAEMTKLAEYLHRVTPNGAGAPTSDREDRKDGKGCGLM